MLKILHFIFGRLYFQVKGYQTERFLNLCAKNHLVLWEYQTAMCFLSDEVLIKCWKH